MSKQAQGRVIKEKTFLTLKTAVWNVPVSVPEVVPMSFVAGGARHRPVHSRLRVGT